MEDTAAHILIVDDDQRLRSLLLRYLAESGYRVTAATDAADAKAHLSGLIFDLIVLDVMMPGESGLVLTNHLRQKKNDVPILLLTAMDEVPDRIAGLEAGADDYLSKPFEPKELVLRIESILRRSSAGDATPTKLSLGNLKFDITRGVLTSSEGPVRLTSAEIELLRLFAKNPGKIIDRVHLLAQSGANSLRAIDVQITRLRKKIESDPREPRLLQTVWGRGYVLWPDETIT